ncbi:MAG: hypothetical protein ACLT76_18375 [Clostridium fessum]
MCRTDLVPKDPMTGELMKPNPFDNRFYRRRYNMGEKAENTDSQTESAGLSHMTATWPSYVTALDLCLAGHHQPKHPWH